MESAKKHTMLVRSNEIGDQDRRFKGTLLRDCCDAQNEWKCLEPVALGWLPKRIVTIQDGEDDACHVRY